MVGQSLYSPEQYIEWFVKSVLVLDDLGYENLATQVSKKLPIDQAFQNYLKTAEPEARRFQAIQMRDMTYYRRPAEKQIAEMNVERLMQSIWLLSILQNKLHEPTLAEHLHQLLKRSWKDNLASELEAKHPKIAEWYKKFKQGHGIIFARKFSGKANDRVSDLIQTQDAGFVMVGSTDSTGQGRDDVLLIRYNSQGKWLWAKTFGGPAKDTGACVIQTKDQGFAILGTTWSIGEGRNDIWLIKTDSQGKELWNKTYGDKRGDEGIDILETKTGELIILASTQAPESIVPEPYLIKTDSAGNVLWKKRLEITDDNQPKKLTMLENGDLLILAEIKKQTQWDLWLLQLNSKGEKIWEQYYGGEKDDRAIDVAATPEGIFILGMTSSFSGGWQQVWLLQTDRDGKKIWEKTLGGKAYNYPTSLVITPDKAWVVAGYSILFGAEKSSSWLIQIDAAGNIIWNKNIGDGQTSTVILCQDQGFAVTGQRISEDKGQDIFLLKSDFQGKFEK